MKQGSTDDPFAEEPASEAVDAEQTEQEEKAESKRSDPEPDSDPDHQTDSGDTETGRRSLPYIHARDGVKDGRTQRPVFLRDHVEQGIDDLVAQMEDEFGEDVYKTDVTEAAMAVAQENPELVSEKLDEWGYGWA